MVVVPFDNTKGGDKPSNGMRLQGVRNLQEMLHYVFKETQGMWVCFD